MKVARHGLGLLACALVAGSFATVWDWLHPIIRPSLADRMSEFDFPPEQFYDSQELIRLFLSWLIVFCLLCFAWFFWNQRLKND
jgi:hypothetical protein